MNFDSIFGHEQIKKHLQNAIQMKKISHAYIFSGEDGVGKSLMAHIFAKTLQCAEKDLRPCGKCKSCLQIASNNHPDIINVTHEKNIISVDDIRIQLNNNISIKPYSSPYKIYIIDEAERLNEQAQNALLKTIEEPPEYAIILLLTNNSSLFLQTILSRCIILQFKAIEKGIIKKYLMEKYQIPDYQAEMSAIFSLGNFGKAIEYALSEEFIKTKDEIIHLMKYLDEMQYYEVIEALKYFADRKQNIDICIDLMMMWFRDVLMFKASKNMNLIMYKEYIGDIQKQAIKRSFEGIEKILNEFRQFKMRLKANVNFEISVELLIIAIKEN